jgi:hypothetical protein
MKFVATLMAVCVDILTMTSGDERRGMIDDIAHQVSGKSGCGFFGVILAVMAPGFDGYQPTEY